MQKIDRLVWAEGMCFESYGMKIGIRASRAGMIARLAPFLPPRCQAIKPPRKLDLLYSWVVGWERRPRVRTFDVLYQGVSRIARTLKPVDLFEAFEADLRMTIALLSRRFVFIHAGAVGWRGRAILIPGRSLTGKSTLVEALVRAGAEYLSDEYAVLDGRGRVHPYAKPISIRVPATFTQELRGVEEIGGRTAECPLRVGAILVTRHRESAESRFRTTSAGQGVLALVANAVAARHAPSRMLRAARNAGANAIVLRGPRGEAREAVEELMRILNDRKSIYIKSHRGGLYGVTGRSALAAEG